MLIGVFESTRIPQMPFVENFAPIIIIEKALLWLSGLPFSLQFQKRKLKFGEGMAKSLIDWMLLFLRRECHWFGVSS